MFEIPLNLEKTTSSVLSVLVLIYGHLPFFKHSKCLDFQELKYFELYYLKVCCYSTIQNIYSDRGYKPKRKVNFASFRFTSSSGVNLLHYFIKD